MAPGAGSGVNKIILSVTLGDSKAFLTTLVASVPPADLFVDLHGFQVQTVCREIEQNQST